MKFKFYFLVPVIALFNCKAQTIPLYVGTYTNGDSEGIYKLDFNTETGDLTNLQLSTSTENPSFITYSHNKKYLYSVGESNETISAFKIQKSGTLELLNTVTTHGGAPCHVSLNTDGTKVVVSNYMGGNIGIYKILEDGSISEASQVFDHNEADEKPAHAHSAKFYKDDLFVSDLGRNRFYQYKLVDNAYQLESKSIINIEGNPGPRHFEISKDGKFIYIINEYGGSITSIERTDTGFKQIDTDSTLDENYEGKNSCADIHLSKDERFLYASNRGENTIAVFERDNNNGTITKIQNISVEGNWPRNFTLDPTGKFLLVANRWSHNISVFSIDSSSGKLKFMHDAKIPEPVCLLF
ncbi:lactonase family protein [Hyunsoonleella aestuarii]|uniref:Lactonase family protein n=1 Tax=Hyunsoonleella aestuarii TaxID=912802 RepID=A0ABP8EB91_9FLAO|nr:lactonase family protein [Hyunsoonleella aestuarii]